MAEDRTRQLKEWGKVQVWRAGDYIKVICPYHEEFNAAAKKLKGIWRPAQRVWMFHSDRYDSVMELVTRVYGGVQRKQQKWCAHRFLKVAGGIKCMLCGLFKDRSV